MAADEATFMQSVGKIVAEYTAIVDSISFAAIGVVGGTFDD